MSAATFLEALTVNIDFTVDNITFTNVMMKKIIVVVFIVTLPPSIVYIISRRGVKLPLLWCSACPPTPMNLMIDAIKYITKAPAPMNLMTDAIKHITKTIIVICTTFLVSFLSLATLPLTFFLI